MKTSLFDKRPFIHLCQQGFSLAELAISMGLTLAIALAISTTTTFLMRQVVKETGNFGLTAEAKMVGLRLQRLVYGAGGGSIKPYQAIQVSNNVNAGFFGLPNGGSSDWLHVIYLQTDLGLNVLQQSISLGPLGYNGATGVIDIDKFFGCPDIDAYLNSVVALVYKQTIRPVVITGSDKVNCRLTSVPHKQGALFSTWVAENFIGGELVPIVVQTYYVDHVDHTLKSFIDADNDGIASAGELTTMIRSIWDLQIALGYDVKALDGVIEDSKNQLDEWLYNSPFDAIGVGGLVNFKPQRLKMVDIQVMIGHEFFFGKDRVAPENVQLLDGIPRPTLNLAYATFAQPLFLRNNSLYIR